MALMGKCAQCHFTPSKIQKFYIEYGEKRWKIYFSGFFFLQKQTQNSLETTCCWCLRFTIKADSRCTAAITKTFVGYSKYIHIHNNQEFFLWLDTIQLAEHFMCPIFGFIVNCFSLLKTLSNEVGFYFLICGIHKTRAVHTNSVCQ